MNDDCTNLLPLHRQRMLSREYFVRLGVVVAVLLTLLTLTALLLLIPTFIFLNGNATVKMARIANVDAVLSSADEEALSTHLAALSHNAAALAALGSVPSASSLIRTTLAIPRPGIILSGFVYTPATGKNQGTLSLSGTAATRTALRSYQIALQSSSFATAADLPVSAYAKDTNIDFTIAVTLVP